MKKAGAAAPLDPERGAAESSGGVSGRISALLGRVALAPDLQQRDLGDGVSQLLLSTTVSRALRFVVSPYLIGELLIDSGFAHVRQPLLRALAGRTVRAICCTHHHEDHVGNAAALSRRHRCPIYLHRPELRLGEGVSRLAPYRLLFWGVPEPYEPLQMPPEIRAGGRVLRAVATPGHCATHCSLFEEATGLLFTGDLFVSGGTSPVLRWENPWEHVRSLRAVAELQPARMLTGHALVLTDPAPRLRRKADRIEAAAEQVLELAAAGSSEREIVARLFPGTSRRELLDTLTTGGQFSRLNFVKACLSNVH